MAFTYVILLYSLVIAYVSSAPDRSARLDVLEKELIDELESDADERLVRDIMQDVQGKRALTPSFSTKHGGVECKDYFNSAKVYTCGNNSTNKPIDYISCKGDVKVGGQNMPDVLEGATVSTLIQIKMPKGKVLDIHPHEGPLALHTFCLHTFGIKTATVVATKPDQSTVTKEITLYMCKEFFFMGCADFEGEIIEKIDMNFENGPPSFYAKRIFGQGCSI